MWSSEVKYSCFLNRDLSKAFIYVPVFLHGVMVKLTFVLEKDAI